MNCRICNKLLDGKKRAFCSLPCYWLSLKNKPAWNKQKRIEKKCVICNKVFSERESLVKERKYCSAKCRNKAMLGRKVESRGGRVNVKCRNCGLNFVAWRYEKRKYCSKRCVGKRNKKEMAREKHWNWKGGISPRVLNSIEYKEWRKAVFERDEYTCQKCGTKKSGVFQAHHIKSWADYPSLRYKVSNGLTLCKNCHKKTDNYGAKKKTSCNK